MDPPPATSSPEVTPTPPLTSAPSSGSPRKVAAAKTAAESSTAETVTEVTETVVLTTEPAPAAEAVNAPPPTETPGNSVAAPAAEDSVVLPPLTTPPTTENSTTTTPAPTPTPTPTATTPAADLEVDRSAIEKNSNGSDEPSSENPELWNIDGCEVDMLVKYKMGGNLWYVQSRMRENPPKKPIPGFPINRTAREAMRFYSKEDEGEFNKDSKNYCAGAAWKTIEVANPPAAKLVC